ncbi:MAG: VWA domain-containing protein [Congregibacter sp.]
MLEFALPLVYLLLPLPWLVYRLLPPYHETRDSLQVPYFNRLVKVSGETPRSGASVLRRRRLQAAVSILGWLLLTSAAAKPEWVGAPIVLEKSARDLMLALDLSGSMGTQDFDSTEGTQSDRLAAAKEVIASFAAQRNGDRLGLIVFGNAAYLQVPFTDDLSTWLSLLEESVVGMAGQSTALGDAIGLSISLFQQSDTQNRVLVVLTDGNDTGSRVPPVDAATIAAAEGVTIYTVAVGDPASVGEEALDMDTLENISSSTGGQSFLALNRGSLESAYAEIDTLEPAQYDRLSYRPRNSLFHYPLSAFALLYLVCLPLFAFLGWRGRHS